MIPRQLAAVDAGGVLELRTVDNGAFELEEVHRFTNRWEAEASLRLRQGDTTVLTEYEDRGRLVGAPGPQEGPRRAREAAAWAPGAGRLEGGG